ncbi:MAG: ATP-binding protein [Candidatus Micrarchaeota archaeon]
MKFVDRGAELEELRELETLSRKKLFIVALYGLRRVGKTRLLVEFLKDRGAYFFVNKNKPSGELLKEFQEILRKHGALGALESVHSWDQFADALVKRNPGVVVFDEFQNFNSVEPAAFGAFQKAIDLNEGSPGLVVLSGSLIGLMKSAFQDAKEPLYGRVKKNWRLEPLSLSSCFDFGNELSLRKEDLVELYGVFGGYPKYYVAAEDYGLQGKTAAQIIDALLLAKNAPLEDEVTGILSQEFGGRSGTYYSILQAIADGSNTLSSIAASLNTPSTSITRQVNELKDYFELIELEMPFSGKRGAYRLKHPLMRFWFTAINRRYSEYASRDPGFISSVKGSLGAYSGRAFEYAAREFAVGKLGLYKARRQWGKIGGGEKGRDAYEIDLMAQDSAKKVYAFEFKWAEVTQPLKEFKALERKAGYVNGLASKPRLGLVARKIFGKNKLRNAGYLAFDLQDM